RANLMHSDSLPPDGTRGNSRVAQARQVLYGIQGHVAELLDKCIDQNALDAVVPKADLEALRDMLAKFGDLTVEKGPPRHVQYDNASGRAGFAIEQGRAGNQGTPLGPLALEEILRSRLWDNFAFREMEYFWQASLLQPKGGMDRIVE